APPSQDNAYRRPGVQRHVGYTAFCRSRGMPGLPARTRERRVSAAGAPLVVTAGGFRAGGVAAPADLGAVITARVDAEHGATDSRDIGVGRRKIGRDARGPVGRAA